MWKFSKYIWLRFYCSSNLSAVCVFLTSNLIIVLYLFYYTLAWFINFNIHTCLTYIACIRFVYLDFIRFYYVHQLNRKFLFHSFHSTIESIRCCVSKVLTSSYQIHSCANVGRLKIL